MLEPAAHAGCHRRLGIYTHVAAVREAKKWQRQTQDGGSRGLGGRGGARMRGQRRPRPCGSMRPVWAGGHWPLQACSLSDTQHALHFYMVHAAHGREGGEGKGVAISPDLLRTSKGPRHPFAGGSDAADSPVSRRGRPGPEVPWALLRKRTGHWS